MKNMVYVRRGTVGIVTVFSIIAMIWSGCGQEPSKKSAPTPEKPPVAAPTPTAEPPRSPADLIISDVRPKQEHGQVYIEIIVQNIGQSLASGVDGVCSYRCISRQFSVTNQSFLQSGYLVPGKSVNGLLALSPCPDESIQLDCIVDPDSKITEINKQNNRWVGSVKIR